MQNIFISGASGFIGQRLVYALSRKDVSIRILSRDMHSEFDTVVCDLSTEKIPDDALSGIDTVFHLAGYTHDTRATNNIEYLYNSINVDATERLLELAVASGVKRFIFVSSVKAGGSALPGKCQSELDQSTPEGLYGKTKREAELKILDIGRKSGMHVSVIRPSLVYGPGVKGNIRSMLLAVKAGWFPPLPNTGNVRSMIHVDDLVTSILFVAENDDANGEIFIATDGRGYSTRDIYNLMRFAMNKCHLKIYIPNFIFTFAAWLGDRAGDSFPFNTYKMNKLLGDECYSSKKLYSLGFKATRTLQSTMSEIVASLRNGFNKHE
ncbi:MAG: NAD-dependent epimerase/dehydratase family protein [Gammaproteobacteria bacterium]|nr:NAD-dependent epimerase/dehydratase family protein [Gammaproteobacteria bacterium]